MPFSINPVRKRTFVYEKDGDRFEADFEWVCQEDVDIAETRKRLQGLTEGVKMTEEDRLKLMSLSVYRMRKSLKAVRGIIDETTGRDIDCSNEDNQKAAFEFIISCEGMYTRIQDSFLGLGNSKNSNSGATPQ
jgi:hypothetical protein